VDLPADAGGCSATGRRILSTPSAIPQGSLQQADIRGKTMARIEYSDPAKADDRTREILGKNRNANIFRMMAHSPDYFRQYCRLGAAIRHRGELDPVVRELAITRTGILCEAPYEIVAHKRIGKGVGVTDEQNAALENWQAATCFNEVQRAALAFTDEIVKLRRPTDATFNAIAAKLTPGALVELQLSVGFYIMTSKFLETFGIDLQPVTEVV
jgi:alkylhydroperoxidase family enzyme